MVLLELESISKAFGGLHVIQDLDLHVDEGEIVSVIGPNGAGKTTLFNLITGHLGADSGQVMLNGRDVTGIAPHRLCRMGMGRSFQRQNIFPRLSVFENIQAAFVSHRGRGWNMFGRVEGLYREETAALLEAVGLRDKADEVAGLLSHGGQKQLELGIALALEPEILLLDEPTAGMSAAETRESMALIGRLARERGLTLLFTEHDMGVVFSIAQRITVLHQGNVIADGSPDDVRRNPEVRQVYLGERN